jgi:hypothetical protein
MFVEAVAEFKHTQSSLPAWPVATAAIGWVYGRSGKRTEARQALAQLESLSKKRYVTAYAIALVYASLDNRDEAFRFLNKGMNVRTNWMVWTATDPRWRSIRDDPRFSALLREMGVDSHLPIAAENSSSGETMLAVKLNR